MAPSPTVSPRSVHDTRRIVDDRYAHGHQVGEALGELCRLRIARVPWLVFLAAGIGAGLGLRSLAAGLVVIGAAVAAAAALNDKADVESDRINGRMDRPLVSGVLEDRHVGWVVAGSSVLVVMGQPLLPQPSGLVATLAAAILAWASACEPVALQRRGWPGLVVLAACYLVIPVGLAGDLLDIVVVMPMALLGAGVLAHKDVRDLVGDRAAGKSTVAVRVGVGPMAVSAAFISSMGLMLTWVTVGLGWWIVGAVVSVGALAFMAGVGHEPRLWMVARLALVTAVVLLAYSVAAQ